MFEKLNPRSAEIIKQSSTVYNLKWKGNIEFLLCSHENGRSGWYYILKNNEQISHTYHYSEINDIFLQKLQKIIDDIEILIEFFINKYTNLLDKSFENIVMTEDVKRAFYRYSWPGNVRELENTIEFIVNMIGVDGIIDKEVIPKNILLCEKVERRLDSSEIVPLKELEEMEIKKALDIYGTTTEDKKKIAKKLGIGIATLYRKIDEYRLLK